MLTHHPSMLPVLPPKPQNTQLSDCITIVCEDDSKVVRHLVESLASSGWHVQVLKEWTTAESLLAPASLIILALDRSRSLGHVRDMCQKVRQYTNCPTVIVSGNFGEGVDSIEFSFANSDVIVDPIFSTNILEYLQRMIQGPKNTMPLNRVLAHGAILLEHHKHKVTVNGDLIPLTPSEYKLLYTLMSSPGRVFLRDELLDVLYEQDGTVVDRVIDVHIGKVRRKIEKDPAHPQHILTVRGLGYKFSDSH